MGERFSSPFSSRSEGRPSSGILDWGGQLMMFKIHENYHGVDPDYPDLDGDFETLKIRRRVLTRARFSSSPSSVASKAVLNILY